MSEILLTVFLLFVLFFLLGSGVWVAFSLLIVGIAGMALFTDAPLGEVMATTIWGASNSWALAALPLFIWMGEILFRSKLSQDMFTGLSPWMNRLPGRLLHVNIFGCAIFAAVSGSSAATAATIGRINPGASLATVGQIVEAFVPFLGETVGKVVFSAGILGAAFVAAIVVSLATAWGLGEVTGYRHSLQRKPAKAPWFYGVYTVMVVGGALVVAMVPDLVGLNVTVEVMNALLLPLVLGLLYALAMRALPARVRPGRIYRWVVLMVVVMTSLLGVYAGLSGILAMAF